MTRSELISALADKYPFLRQNDVESIVKTILDVMAQQLSLGNRIEIRGFGSFALVKRSPRNGRNPRTGESVQVPEKRVPHFKPGMKLRLRVDKSIAKQRPQIRLRSAEGGVYEAAMNMSALDL